MKVVISKMQSQDQVSYHFTPIRMPVVKQQQQKISVGKDVEKLESQHIAVKLLQLLWKRVWSILKVLNHVTQ